MTHMSVINLPVNWRLIKVSTLDICFLVSHLMVGTHSIRLLWCRRLCFTSVPPAFMHVAWGWADRGDPAINQEEMRCCLYGDNGARSPAVLNVNYGSGWAQTPRPSHQRFWQHRLAPGVGWWHKLQLHANVKLDVMDLPFATRSDWPSPSAFASQNSQGPPDVRNRIITRKY